MRFKGLLFVSIIVLLASTAASQTSAVRPAPAASSLSFPTKPQALIICAGNVPPDNMAITATGTSYTCSGSCRSRQVEPVWGPIMVICAGQPIPQYYETESITSTPACDCLGEQDNAYVIRRLSTAPTPSPSQSPTAPGAGPGSGNTSSSLDNSAGTFDRPAHDRYTP